MEKREETLGDDFETLELYSINALIDAEDDDSPILKMLEYWLELRQGKAVAPRVESLQMARLWQMKIPHRVTITDCSQDDPRNFRILHHADDVRGESGILGIRLSGHVFSSLPNKLHTNGVQRDYADAKICQDPATLFYHRINQRLNRRERTYARLLLPFTGTGGRVTMLVAVVRSLQHPRIVEAA